MSGNDAFIIREGKSPRGERPWYIIYHVDTADYAETHHVRRPVWDGPSLRAGILWAQGEGSEYGVYFEAEEA